MNYPKSKSFNEGLRAVPYGKFREVKACLMAALGITSEPAWRRRSGAAGQQCATVPEIVGPNGGLCAGLENVAQETAGSNGGVCAGGEAGDRPEENVGPERWVTLPREVYGEACRRLCDAIDGDNYFNGEVRFRVRNIDCRLAASVIVYRRREEVPEGVQEPILDLVPVWWEFHTARDGGEMLNDFSFGEMKRYI